MLDLTQLCSVGTSALGPRQGMPNDCQRFQTWIVHGGVFGEALSEPLLWWINKCGAILSWIGHDPTQSLESGVEQGLFDWLVYAVFCRSGVQKNMFVQHLNVDGLFCCCHTSSQVSALLCSLKKGLFVLCCRHSRVCRFFVLTHLNHGNYGEPTHEAPASLPPQIFHYHSQCPLNPYCQHNCINKHLFVLHSQRCSADSCCVTAAAECVSAGRGAGGARCCGLRVLWRKDGAVIEVERW